MTKLLSKPVIAVNFKVYREVEGENALKITRICEEVSKESGIRIIACPPMTELGVVARNVNIPIFSQNADARAPGSSTGWVTPTMIKTAGAVGTLINHSEHKQSLQNIGETVELCKGADLLTMVCADTTKTAVSIAAFHPDCIAVEPPELIGGDISVTSANPAIVEKTVESVKNISKNISVFCGAGVKTGDDVWSALDLGADGVLLASGVVKSKDPKASLLDLIKRL